MACARERPGETVLVKTTSSAFPSTSLETHLRERGIARLFVVGAVAGFCVNSTVRSASAAADATPTSPAPMMTASNPAAGRERVWLGWVHHPRNVAAGAGR